MLLINYELLSFVTSPLLTAFLDRFTFLDLPVHINSVQGVIRGDSNPDCFENRLLGPRIIRELVPLQARVAGIDLTSWASFEENRLERVSRAIPVPLGMVELRNFAIGLFDDPGFVFAIRVDPPGINVIPIFDRGVLRLDHINLVFRLFVNVQSTIASNSYAETISSDINLVPLRILLPIDVSVVGDDNLANFINCKPIESDSTDGSLIMDVPAWLSLIIFGHLVVESAIVWIFSCDPNVICDLAGCNIQSSGAIRDVFPDWGNIRAWVLGSDNLY